MSDLTDFHSSVFLSSVSVSASISQVLYSKSSSVCDGSTPKLWKALINYLDLLDNLDDSLRMLNDTKLQITNNYVDMVEAV